MDETPSIDNPIIPSATAPLTQMAALAAQMCDSPAAFIAFPNPSEQWMVLECYGIGKAEASSFLPLRDMVYDDPVRPLDFRLLPDFASADPSSDSASSAFRSFAGIQIKHPTQARPGVLCLVDFHLRSLSEVQSQSLAQLAQRYLGPPTQDALKTDQSLPTTAVLYAALQRMVAGFWLVNESHQIQQVSDSYCRLIGYGRSELLRMDLADPALPIYSDSVTADHLHDFPLEPITFETRHKTKSGQDIDLSVNLQSVRQPDGTLCHCLFFQDISVRKQEETALRESKAKYATLFDASPQTITLTSLEDGIYFDVNQRFTAVTGYSASEVLGKSSLDLGIWADVSERKRLLAHLAQQGAVRDWEIKFRHKSGHCWTGLVTAHVVEVSSQSCILMILTDISERVAMEAERERLLVEAVERADRDPLTGLFNHRAFHKRFREEWDISLQQRQPLSVSMLDLDNFKYFNDVYGHTVGDEVLRQVADVLRQYCRENDTLARFGGDEFAMLMPGLETREAEALVERVQECLTQIGYKPPGYDIEIPLGLSYGVASSAELDAPRDLLALADMRLRHMKAGGNTRSEAEALRSSLIHSIEGFSMLDALVTAVNTKDCYTRRHSEDVLTYSVGIASALGWNDTQLHTVAVAALLHDVGKIGVPDNILRKPGRLTEEEYAAIRQHPMMGAVMVGAVPGFEDTLDAIRHHHERWDGEGYPFGLRGAETPVIARLMAVADAYSAMTTDRPYRKSMEPEKARALLKAGAGRQWDPLCVDSFLRSEVC